MRGENRFSKQLENFEARKCIECIDIRGFLEKKTQQQNAMGSLHTLPAFCGSKVGAQFPGTGSFVIEIPASRCKKDPVLTKPQPRSSQKVVSLVRDPKWAKHSGQGFTINCPETYLYPPLN